MKPHILAIMVIAFVALACAAQIPDSGMSRNHPVPTQGIRSQVLYYGVQLRAPNMEVIEKLDKGDWVIVVGRSGDWCSLKGGNIVWCGCVSGFEGNGCPK